MKKKEFCFKRAVSLLLAAALILTAVPQTGLTAFATELGDKNVEGSDSAGSDGLISTPETGDGQTELGDGLNQTPETGNEQTESGDGSENGGDNDDPEPGDEIDPDDTGDMEPGNTEVSEEDAEPAEEQEADGEDTEDIVSEEETVSENPLGVELLAEGDAPEGEEETKYIGEIGDDSRLIISVYEAGSEQEVINILTARKDNNERFQCVQLDMKDTGSKSRKIKKNILNAAVAVLNTEDDRWIDYNFYNDSTNEWRSFTLNQPWICGGDIDANVTMTPVAGLGVKVKFPVVSFPAEYVSVNVGGDNMAGTLAASLDGAGEENDGWNFSKYSMFTMSSGKPAAYVDGGEVWYTPAGVEDSEGKDIWIGNINNVLKANTEYLMAPVADEEPIAAGGTKQLEKPTGWTDVTWKSYTPDIISINASGNLSAWDEEDALYSVTGKEGNVWKAKFYRMKVGEKQLSMKFESEEFTMELDLHAQKDDPDYECRKYLQLYYYPSDAGCNQGNPHEIKWSITDSKPANASKSPVIELVKNESGNDCGEIKALNDGTATVTATYVPSQGSDSPITATCTVTVKGRLDWSEVESEVDNMNLYAVSGCDTKLKDVELPDGWQWVYPDLSLTPFAGTEGHEFVAECTKDNRSAQFTIWVRMINLKGIVMTSLQPKEENSTEMDWVDWIPDFLEGGDELALSFYYDLENLNDDNAGEVEAALSKLQEKYEIEWSSNPKGQLQEVKEDDEDPDPTIRSYTASILGTGKNYKPEKKTFTVSLKDTTVKKTPVAFKASHTLTVTTKPLFDLYGMINDELEGGNLCENYDEVTGKLTSLMFTVNMPLDDYKKQKLTFASMDNTILQLDTKKIKEAKPKDSDGNDITDAETTEVTIPCTKKGFGRVWIKVTAPDEMKSSRLFCVELPDIQPKIVGAATQTINKASTALTVPVYVSTHEQYPLVQAEDAEALVSIAEVKIKGDKKDKKEFFELTDITELSGSAAAAVLSEVGGKGSDPRIGLYEMTLGLKDTALKAGDYTVKLACTVQGRHEGSEPEYQTVSLTVRVADVKPKVSFKQTGKVNLFYNDDEGAGTLQINTSETIRSIELVDYTDKNPKKSAACHYALRPKQIESEGEGGEEPCEENVYDIVRKEEPEDDASFTFNEKMKKGILVYEVEGYAGSFQTTFTVATENKAPSIVLSTKSDTLYPEVWYWDSWISMTDKATGEAFIPDKAKYYELKGRNRVNEQTLEIGAFDDDPDSDEQRSKEKEITGSASKNTYGLFVANDGNIVSRLREIDPKNGKKTDTINLEFEKDNWSKPVAVSYKLQVDTTSKPKLTLGKATLTLNKNADVYRGQQVRTTLRLKGFNDWIRYDDNWISINGQDDKSKAELKGNRSSLVIQYWDDRGDVIVRFNDNDIATGTYKFKISVGKYDEPEYASTVLTVKIEDKAVKQSLKVTAKGSIDVLNREGTFISYTPKISNLTGTVVDGWLAGKDADLFKWDFEDGKLIVKADEWRRYSTKVTYEVHTVFRVQTEDWNGYEISSNNDPKAKPFKIKVKQGKPKLTATTNGNTIYRQLENRVNIRIEAMLGKQEVEIEDVWLLNYWGDLMLKEYYHQEGDWVGNYDPETKSVQVKLQEPWDCNEIQKNGTYKVKFAVRYRDKAGDAKEAEVICPIAVR